MKPRPVLHYGRSAVRLRVAPYPDSGMLLPGANRDLASFGTEGRVQVCTRAYAYAATRCPVLRQRVRPCRRT
eukprot:242763-Rhodomonas_salina.1